MLQGRSKEMLKEIPGYKVILKSVLKAQIQMLVEQLSSETDEESVILTASLTDGTLCNLGSSSGKQFLEGKEEFKTQFLFHCLRGNFNIDSVGAESSDTDIELQNTPSENLRRPLKRPCNTLPSVSAKMSKMNKMPPSQINKERNSGWASSSTSASAKHAFETSEITSDNVEYSAVDHTDEVKSENAEPGTYSELDTEQVDSKLENTNNDLKHSEDHSETSLGFGNFSAVTDNNDTSNNEEDAVASGFTEFDTLEDNITIIKVEPDDAFESYDAEAGTKEMQVLSGNREDEMDKRNEKAEQSSSTRKRSKISLAKKYNAILEMEKGDKSRKEIAEMFNVSIGTFSMWIKNAEAIKRGYAIYDPQRNRMKPIRNSELDTTLFKWYCDMRDQKVQLSGPMVLRKAKDLSEKLNLKELKLSTRWLDRFKERHGIFFRKIKHKRLKFGPKHS